MSHAHAIFSVVHQQELGVEMETFLADRRARGLAPGSLRFYTQKLAPLRAFLQGVGVQSVQGITPQHLRAFLQGLGESHSPGGVHGHYRAAKAFLRWYEQEEEPEGWRNPITKVHPPKVPEEPLAPVPVEDVRRMLDASRGRGLMERRDRAVLLCLLDTGCRASELLALNAGDVDLAGGTVLVRHGKGGRVRTVCLGRTARRALKAYLRMREGLQGAEPLFATREGTRLRYEGLRDIVRRRAARAGVPAPTLHAFRRGFALACLRNGMDVFSLQRLMGHADLTVLRRYLHQTTEDVQNAHRQSGPVDHLL
ncbi:MAG: tyrosine-type recombinase/integrase [Chloroflexi bacterium]|nr:tyrosine-type recombinase/integrase [Chloroflexota bacterium]